MEEIVKLIIPFLIFLFFIFRTLSQRKAKAQEEAERLNSPEVEEENEVRSEKEMTRRDLKRWFTEEQKRSGSIQKQNAYSLHTDLQRKENPPAYQSVDSMMEKNSHMKKQIVEEVSVPGTSPLIRLRSKEDAKLAFLYSEIFNRKY